MVTTRRRRIVRWLGGAAALLLLVLIAAAVVAQTAAFRDWLRREVVARVNTGLAGRLAIGSLDGNLYGRLVARDIRLVDLDGARVLAIRRAEARYDALALLRGGGLRLSSLAADGVTLQLVEDSRGWNVARLSTAPRSDDERFALVLERLRVTNGAIRVIRPGDVWRFRDLTVEGDATFAPAETTVTVGALTFRELGRRLVLLEGVGRMRADAERGLHADDVTLRTERSELRLRAAVGPAEDRAVDAELTVVNLAAAELAPFLRGRTPLRDVRGSVRARGPAGAVAVTGELGARGDDARSAIRVEGTVDLSAEVPGGDLGATLTTVDLRDFLGGEAPDSDLSGTVRLRSPGSLPRTGTFEAELQSPRAGTTSLERLAIHGKADADTVTFEASAATTAGAAEASGTVSPASERFDVRVTARDLDAAALAGRDALRGTLTGTATVTGDGFDPWRARAAVQVALAPSRVGGVAISAAELRGRVDAGRVQVERMTIASNAGTAEVAGTLSVAPGGAPRGGDARGALRIRDLRPLAALAAQDLRGAGVVTLTARGEADAFELKGHVAMQGLAGADWRTAAIEGDVVGQRLGAGDARLEVHAQARDVAFGARRMSTLDLDADWRGTPSEGRGAFDLRAREGDRRHHLATDVTRRGDEARAQVTALRLESEDDTWTVAGTPQIVQRGDRMTIESLVVRGPRGSARVEGVLTRSGTNDLTLVADAFDLQILKGTLPEDVTGELSGRAHLGGTGAAPRLVADLTVAAPTLGGVRYDELAAKAAVGGGQAEIESRLVESPGRVLRFEGALPVHFTVAPLRLGAAGNLDGRLRAEHVDLAFLGALVPGLVTKTGGTLDADLAIGGPVASPDARGMIVVEGGRAHVVPLGIAYDPIALELRVEGRAVSIARLSIASGKGRLSGGGNARLAADGAVMDARFEATNFPLFANQYGRGAASGWLWISGTLAAPVLEGSLTTDGLVLQIPEVLPSSVRRADPTIVVVGPGAPPIVAAAAAAAPPAPVPGLLERAAVTVQLAVPHDAWVRRSDANIELAGWMTAWKKPGAPLQLSGDIRGVRGWYVFQGKKFTLAEGNVRFSGQGLDPVLDIVASHRAGDYDVRLRVGGTVTKPTLKLESEPALEQADVLSVLLFGAPANQLSGEQSAGLREQALGIAGGYVASELRQSVANALGVDDLQFDTGQAGLQDAKVSIGKYVAPDIFVSLAHRFGAQTAEEVRIEYRFRPGWSLETSTDTVGRSGVDVFWKRRY